MNKKCHKKILPRCCLEKSTPVISPVFKNNFNQKTTEYILNSWKIDSRHTLLRTHISTHICHLETFMYAGTYGVPLTCAYRDAGTFFNTTPTLRASVQLLTTQAGENRQTRYEM